MATCRACTGPLAAADHYCARCGAAVADDIEMLGAEAMVGAETRVARSGPSPATWSLVGAVVGIAGLIWFLSAVVGGADAAPTLDDEAAVEEPSPTGDDATTTSSAPSASTTTSPQPDEDETTTSMIGTGPVLGREVGWSLWIGAEQRDLQRLDLDTGAVTEFELRGLPVFANDSRLVLGSNERGSLRSVLLEDPLADPVDLSSTQWGTGVLRSARPDHVWKVGGDYEEVTLDLVSVNDGTVAMSLDSPIFFGLAAGGVPLVVPSPDGGIFEWDGGSFRRLNATGLVAASDEHLLVQSCHQPTDCSLTWLARPSLGEVDRPTPDIGQRFGGTLSQGGRVLTVFDFDGVIVYDVERGVEVPIGSNVYDVTMVAVSPDERFVAVASGVILIHDLDTGDIYDTGIVSNQGALLFVE